MRSGPRLAAVVAVLTGTVVVPAVQAGPAPLLCAHGGPAATFSGSVAPADAKTYRVLAGQQTLQPQIPWHWEHTKSVTSTRIGMVARIPACR